MNIKFDKTSRKAPLPYVGLPFLSLPPIPKDEDWIPAFAGKRAGQSKDGQDARPTRDRRFGNRRYAPEKN